MDLREIFAPGGRGIIATSAKDGTVNTAVYAAPQVIDGETVAWGMTDGRTWDNIRGNPRASYAYFDSGDGYRGCRLTLSLERTEDGGETLRKVRERAATASPAAPGAIRHVAYFKVIESRPLV
jgi:hypothetical protein